MKKIINILLFITSCFFYIILTHCVSLILFNYYNICPLFDLGCFIKISEVFCSQFNADKTLRRRGVMTLTESFHTFIHIHFITVILFYLISHAQIKYASRQLFLNHLWCLTNMCMCCKNKK